ncbi:VOC family protein [Streptomyces antnestii]|uniref:VOC family protein n=1 Tax=Streptomyces antnestii TaxID=2494256 RepID=A0A437PZZ5_9ACTN|nr:VOC family protein [Streptomyces sp. San01]RVU27823.1 VOC family protein [Streptomyces sp. San01]
MTEGLATGAGDEDGLPDGAVLGAPCWVSLAAHDLAASRAFYEEVLGWEFRPGSLGDRFAVALTDGRPVAGIGAVAPALGVATAWMPYFAVADPDETAGRVRERSGTVGVGPIPFALGRAALLSDPSGAAFGIWAGQLMRDWSGWRPDAPVGLRLVTRDAFEAAIFYGQVLGWTGPGGCDVAYEDDEVVLVCGGRHLARISSGAVEAAPDPDVRPHWEVRFTVDDVADSARAAVKNDGAVTGEHEDEAGLWATLRDGQGAQFTVFTPHPAGERGQVSG